MVATGIGVVFNSTLPGFLDAFPGCIDYVELIPETLWMDRGRGTTNRYVEISPTVQQLTALAARLPIACHGVGLSIGSALPLDEQHLSKLREVLQRYRVTRFSEHLGCSRATDTGQRHIGLGMGPHGDDHVLERLVPRVRRAMSLLGTTIIFENGARHAPFVQEHLGEPLFLNQLALATGCGVLLDLHHLYVDCCNNGWHPDDYLSRLDLSIVREIHVANTNLSGNEYTASHAACPSEVWNLLRQVVPHCPFLEGITFELHDSNPASFDRQELLAELTQLTELWQTRGRQRRVDCVA